MVLFELLPSVWNPQHAPDEKLGHSASGKIRDESWVNLTTTNPRLVLHRSSSTSCRPAVVDLDPSSWVNRKHQRSTPFLLSTADAKYEASLRSLVARYSGMVDADQCPMLGSRVQELQARLQEHDSGKRNAD